MSTTNKEAAVHIKTPYSVIISLAVGATIVLPLSVSVVLADVLKREGSANVVLIPLEEACPDRSDYLCVLAEAQKESRHGKQ
ncbi:hypothetical protein [Zavarzinella formosa]|uniref:hypothetical protein n=1 Tax=Zavarzinella formosa TaxID=360055 RepID=UPI000496E533|nr:hypothetical protein [Zavarzinella formosa]